MTDQLGIIIGRDPKCDLVVDDPYISKVHARIVVRNGFLWIEDEASINGTWVNGLKVWSACLDAGTDKVKLGNTEWTVGELVEQIRRRFQ